MELDIASLLIIISNDIMSNFGTGAEVKLEAIVVIIHFTRWLVLKTGHGREPERIRILYTKLSCTD